MKREITVHCIAQTRTNHEQMRAWLREVGAHEFADKLPWPAHGDVTDAELLTAVCGKRCYNSFEVGLNPNVSKIREDWGAYLTNVLASGHGSVTEHATWTWAVEGCTRVMTAEANRHRAGVAISEASLRYIRFDSAEGIPYWEPLSIRPCPTCNGRGEHKCPDCSAATELKKEATRRQFEAVFSRVLEGYQELERIWAEELNDPSSGAFARKKQLTSMFRRIVPMGVSTGVVYTLNTRALRHVMTMRCSPAAEEEILDAFGQIAVRMVGDEHRLFGDFEKDGPYWRPKHVKV